MAKTLYIFSGHGKNVVIQDKVTMFGGVSDGKASNAEGVTI